MGESTRWEQGRVIGTPFSELLDPDVQEELKRVQERSIYVVLADVDQEVAREQIALCQSPEDCARIVAEHNDLVERVATLTGLLMKVVSPPVQKRLRELHADLIAKPTPAVKEWRDLANLAMSLHQDLLFHDPSFCEEEHEEDPRPCGVMSLSDRNAYCRLLSDHGGEHEMVYSRERTQAMCEPCAQGNCRACKGHKVCDHYHGWEGE